MLYLHIITINVISLFFHIYNIVLKICIIFAFNFTLRTLIWHLAVCNDV